MKSNNKTFFYHNSQFMSFVSTPIVLNNYDQCYVGDKLEFTKDKAIKNVDFYRDNFTSDSNQQRLRFIGNCGNIIIAGCLFKNLHCNGGAQPGGGAIYIEQEASITLHECNFVECHSTNNGGAVLVCGKKQGDTHVKHLHLH